MANKNLRSILNECSPGVGYPVFGSSKANETENAKIPGPEFPIKKTDEFLSEEEQFEQQLNEIGEGNSTIFPTRIRAYRGGQGYVGTFDATSPNTDEQSIGYIAETISMSFYQELIDIVARLLCPDDLEEREMCALHIDAMAPSQLAAYDILFHTELGGFDMTNRGQIFPIMATVTDFLKKVIQKEKPRDLLVYKFSGTAKNQQELSSAVTQRTRLYMQFVKKNIVSSGFDCFEDAGIVYLIKINI